jgi:hypothetical protein
VSGFSEQTLERVACGALFLWVAVIVVALAKATPFFWWLLTNEPSD